MKIGYFITACNEYDELAKLLVLLRTNILKTDCIGILLMKIIVLRKYKDYVINF